jgi:hypothetical protein
MIIVVVVVVGEFSTAIGHNAIAVNVLMILG